MAFIFGLAEGYHWSSFKFCTKKPASDSPARSDACTFMFEVQNRLRGLAAARDSRRPSESHKIQHFKLPISLPRRQCVLVPGSFKRYALSAGKALKVTALSSYWFHHFWNGYMGCTLINLKVSEMKAEYFPPKEDVILQNEAPTDLYILVTGAVVTVNFCPRSFSVYYKVN